MEIPTPFIEMVRDAAIKYTKALSQTRLAEVSQVGQSEISNFVKSRSDMSTKNFCRVAAALGYEVVERKADAVQDELTLRAKIAQEVGQALIALGIQDQTRHLVQDVINQLKSADHIRKAAGER